MKKLVIISFFFIVALSSCVIAPEDREYRLQYGEIFFEADKNNSFYVIDLDGDGASEIVRTIKDPMGIYPEYRLTVFDKNILHINTFIFDFTLFYLDFYDVNNDGIKELVISYRKNTGVFVTAINPFNREVIFNKKIETVKLTRRNNKTVWHGSCQVFACADLNHDGYDELLIKVKGHYAVYPREIVAYDAHNDTILWKYKHASIQSFFSSDLNGDGRAEIFVNASSPGNGAVYDNSDDSHSYFLILDENGKEIINAEAGYEGSQNNIIVNDFDGDGKKELITLLTTGNHDPTKQKHSLTKWDYSGFPKLKKIKSDSLTFYEECFQILPYKGENSLCVTDNRGFINILDKDLNVLKIVQTESKISSFSGKFDLNGNGSEENLWISTASHSIFVYDEDFNRIAKIPMLGKIFYFKKGKNKPAEIIAENPELKLQKIKLVSFISPEKKRELIVKNSLLALAILLFVYLIYYFLYGSWKWYGKQLLAFQSGRSAMLAADGKGNITFANEKCADVFQKNSSSLKRKNLSDLFAGTFSPVLDWYKKVNETGKDDNKNFLVGLGEAQKEYNFSVKFIQSKLRRFEGALILIDDVTPFLQSKRTDVWLTVAQKLAHEIKTPLTSILLTLQKIKMDFETDDKLKSEYEKTILRSLDDVGVLKKVVDEFLRFSRVEKFNPEPVNIVDIINKLASRYKLRLPKNAELIVEIDENVSVIKADETHLSTAFSIFLDNAIEALGEDGKVSVKLFADKNNFIRIIIEDNGCGIGKDDLPKLFNLFYTTKEGGAGLGLIIAKRIIEDHNGTVEIKSEKGKGTKVIILLPVAETKNKPDFRVN